MVISFLSFICPYMFLLKKKNMQRKIKSEKIKNAFKYDCKRVF